MATLAAVYSVDRHVRSAKEIVAALFRDPRDEQNAPMMHALRCEPLNEAMSTIWQSLPFEPTQQ